MERNLIIDCFAIACQLRIGRKENESEAETPGTGIRTVKRKPIT